jgi:uncharacterized protein
VADYVKAYMSRYDASHDFSHIERVVGLAHHIYDNSPDSPVLDLRLITIAALLHDVGDRKYLGDGEDAGSLIYRVLVDRGAPVGLAETVQTICLGVSYSTETKDPRRAKELIALHPELAVVQDADRIDAIGAVGIARVFTFGGAKTRQSMEEAVQHFEDKLLRLEAMMKTDAGRDLARERTRRLDVFKAWWAEETRFSQSLDFVAGA